MKNALLPLDDKRYLKRCSEFDRLFRDTRQVLKKQEDAGNEIAATPPPKRPKTKTPRPTKKIKSPTPTPLLLPMNPTIIVDGSSTPSPEKVVKKAAVSAKNTKPKRAAKSNKQPVIPPILATSAIEFDTGLKNTDNVIMPPPPTPPPLLPTPPPINLKKEITLNYQKMLPGPAAQSSLKPLTIQSLPQPPPPIPVQKLTANPMHSPPSIINLSSPKPTVSATLFPETKHIVPLLPGTSFVPGNTKMKNQVVLNNYKFTSAPTSSLSPLSVGNRGNFKLITSGNGKVCLRLADGSPQKTCKTKINIQNVQIIKPATKPSSVILGKSSILTAGSKPFSIVKSAKFLTSNIKHGNHSTNSNVIVLGSLPSPSSNPSPIASSSTTITDNMINEDTPVDILSAPIEIADGDDGDALNNHSSAIVTDWEMELDQETNKNKNVEVSEVYSMEEGSTEIVEYEGDESFNDVIVEEDDETIIVDDGVTDGDFNKTSEGYGEFSFFHFLLKKY